MQLIVHGELFISLYSAENFYRNMREYYSHIDDLYMNTPSDENPLIDIIKDIPPTCGWIVLILEDLELLSGKLEEMKEMMESIFAFASRRPSIVLVGEGNYIKVFVLYGSMRS